MAEERAIEKLIMDEIIEQGGLFLSNVIPARS